MIEFYKKNKELFFFSIILLISLITLAIMFFKIDFNKNTEYEDFSDGWKYENEVVDLTEVSKYDYVIKKVPDIDKDTYIYLNVNNLFVDVYMDKKLVYSYEEYDKYIFDKTPGSYFIKIKLSESDDGKEIKLDINDIYKDNSAKIKNIYIGNDFDIAFDMIWSQLLSLILSVIIIFAGFVLLIMFILSKRFIDVSVNKFLYLSLFALIIGLFTFTDSKVIQILNGNEYFYNTVSGACRILLTVPMALFIGESYRRISDKKITYMLAYLGMINFIICYTLNMLNILDYHESLFLTHSIYIIDACYLLYLFWKSLTLKSKKEIFHTIGLLFIAIGCLLDLIILYYSNSLQTTLCTRLGVTIFLTLEGFKFYLDFLDKFRHKQKMEFLKQLAYKDGLTELLNRTSFMEDLEKLSDCKDGLIAVYDVNDLKKVNDNYGHTEGDNLITGVSDALKSHLLKIGKCYRIGGDEFVFISTTKGISKEFLEAHDAFIQQLKKHDEEMKNKYSTSVAMGYSRISKNININDAFEKADANMYKNKRKMKK